MRLATPYERIQNLIQVISRASSKQHLIDFLSNAVDPLGETCGAGWVTVDSNGYLQGVATSGLEIDLDPNIPIAITDSNIVAESLRLEKLQIFSMTDMFLNYSKSTQKNKYSFYISGVTIPLDSRNIVTLVLVSPTIQLKEFEQYFEVVRSVLRLWHTELSSKDKMAEMQFSLHTDQLTKRQERIVEEIKAGRTNDEIANRLGYSTSLIRHETMLIYRKLRISGRQDLIQ